MENIGIITVSARIGIREVKDLGFGLVEVNLLLRTRGWGEHGSRPKQFYLENATVVAEKRHRNSEKDDGTDHLDVFSNTSDMDEETGGTLPAELTTEGHALGRFSATTVAFSR
jgi:hypothetical protein